MKNDCKRVLSNEDFGTIFTYVLTKTIFRDRRFWDKKKLQPIDNARNYKSKLDKPTRQQRPVRTNQSNHMFTSKN